MGEVQKTENHGSLGEPLQPQQVTCVNQLLFKLPDKRRPYWILWNMSDNVDMFNARQILANWVPDSRRFSKLIPVESKLDCRSPELCSHDFQPDLS